MRRALSARDWAAIAAVTVVTFLAATTVTVMVAPRHDRPGLVANKAGLETPTPAPSPSSAPTPIAEKASDVQLTAPSAAVVWALVDYDSLFVSVDSGAHWDKRSMPANFGVRPSISFISPAEGWLLAPGSPATQCQAAQADVWHTTDGAKTWQQVNGGFSEAQCKESVWFVDSQHGFVTAWDQNHRPTVYHTSDGGYHWAPATVPDNPIFVTGAGGFTLRVGWIKSFGKTVYLEASGTQHDPTWPRDFIYISRDGGATWTWKQKIASPHTYMVTEQRWLQLAPDVLESIDGGHGFAPFTTDLHPMLPLQAVFGDAMVGYAANAGTVSRTVDGGAHWAPVTTPGVAQPG